MKQLACFAIVLLVACAPRESASTTKGSGDTTVVTIPKPSDTRTRTATIELLWDDPRLGEPTGIVSVGSNLVVADRDRLHLLTANGEYIRSIGRRGGGPGEFTLIAGIASRGDRVAVLDSRQQQISLFDSLGALVGTHRIVNATGFPNVNPLNTVMAYQADGIVWSAKEMFSLVRRTRVALIRDQLQSQPATLVAAWDDGRLVDYGGTLSDSLAFDSRAVLAVGSDGSYAAGMGTEYCVNVHRPALTNVVRVCREYERVRVSQDAKHASVDGLAISAERANGLRLILPRQPVADELPAYDELRFDDGGHLWVRLSPPEYARVHPLLRDFRPEVNAPHRWERLDETHGLVEAVMFPAGFEPSIFRGAEAIGFMELETGEVAVARARW